MTYAEKILKHYARLAKESGVYWDADNDAEVAEALQNIANLQAENARLRALVARKEADNA